MGSPATARKRWPAASGCVIARTCRSATSRTSTPVSEPGGSTGTRPSRRRAAGPRSTPRSRCRARGRRWAPGSRSRARGRRPRARRSPTPHARPASSTSMYGVRCGREGSVQSCLGERPARVGAVAHGRERRGLHHPTHAGVACGAQHAQHAVAGGHDELVLVLRLAHRQRGCHVQHEVRAVDGLGPSVVVQRSAATTSMASAAASVADRAPGPARPNEGAHVVGSLAAAIAPWCAPGTAGGEQRHVCSATRRSRCRRSRARVRRSLRCRRTGRATTRARAAGPRWRRAPARGTRRP